MVSPDSTLEGKARATAKIDGTVAAREASQRGYIRHGQGQGHQITYGTTAFLSFG